MLFRGGETSEFELKRSSISEMKRACRPKTASRQLHYNYRVNKTIIFRTFHLQITEVTCQYIFMEEEVELWW